MMITFAVVFCAMWLLYTRTGTGTVEIDRAAEIYAFRLPASVEAKRAGTSLQQSAISSIELKGTGWNNFRTLS